MAEQVEGLKLKISADVTGAIAAINAFHTTFKNMSNSINGTVLNVQGNMNSFSTSIQDLGSLKNIEQMQHLQDIMNDQRTKKSIELTTKSLEKQNKVLVKMKNNLLAIALATYAVIKVSTLMNIWMSESSQLLGFFIDSALLPLSPLIEGILTVMWMFSDWFAGLDPIIQGAVGALGLVAGAIAVWSVIGPTVMAILTTLGGIFTWLGAIIGGLSLPVLAVIAAIVAVAAIAWYLYNNWDTVIAKIGVLWDWLKTKISDIWESIKTYLKEVWDKIWTGASTVWESIKESIVNAIRGAWNIVSEIIDKIKNAITSIPGVSTAISMAKNAWSGVTSYLGYAQGTEYVPATGLYKLHAGEAVIPASQNRGSGTSEGNNQSVVFNNSFNISASIKSDTDVRQLASQLSSYFRDDMIRYVRGTV